MHRTTPVLLAAALVALTPGDARATTVRRMNLSELVALAHTAVRGEVLSSRSELLRGGLVVTVHRLRVEEDFRNPARRGQEIELCFPGGTHGGVRCVVPGMPSLRVGERALLFTTAPGTNGACLPIGLAQGCYHLATDPRTGRETASRNFSGLELIDPRTGRPIPRHALGGAEDLEALQSEVRGLVRSGR